MMWVALQAIVVAYFMVCQAMYGPVGWVILGALLVGAWQASQRGQ